MTLPSFQITSRKKRRAFSEAAADADPPRGLGDRHPWPFPPSPRRDTS